LKKINLDVVIGSPECEVDMQFGLDILKGTSDVVSLITEAILAGEIPASGRRTHRSNDVRTKLKQSFRSSFGQRFSIEISKPELKQKLRRMGDLVFLEVLSYFILEALYLDSGNLSDEASAVLDDIGDLSDNLFKRVKRPLIEMHQISKYYQYDLKLRYKRRGEDEHKQLVCLTEDTSKKLTETHVDEDIFTIEAVIIRYHSKTGNGRLHIRGGSQFYSFGFASLLSVAKRLVRQKLSGNLHINNLVEPEKGTFIKLRVKRIALPTGDTVKFLVVGLLDDV
tara:strand:+ start:91845 stop:92687 length:843 start_codon:yes stop_codon:yes gene_type:complete